VYTDADGYYMYPYKHKARSATYYVDLGAPWVAEEVAVVVKANGFAAVNFELP
jgi:hypothetical protein